MLKKQICFVFGFVFVLVAGQQRPSRPPKPPRLSGSYSDYPGLLVNKNPIQTNRQQNVQNNVLPPPRVSSVSSSSNVVRKPSGPIVIPAASSGYRGLPSNASPMVVPPQSSTYNGLPRSAQGIPVSVIAAAELSQQYEKPKAPIKTGTDTWTPMGFTGDGKSFDMSTSRPKTGSNQAAVAAQNVTPQPQPVPYDTTASKKTIGQQIIERQQKQQQQQPQQYDIFGFPIDNSQGKSQYRIPQNPDLFEVIVNTIDMQNDQSRLRRHAVRAHPNGIVEPNKGFYPPRPPKDLPKPAPRRRPPPPPPLQEEMFQNQQETVQPKTNSKPRYSGGVSPTPGKKVKKDNATPAKNNEKPIPTTTSTPSKSAKPTKTKNNKVPKEKKTTKTTPKPIVKPKITKKSKPKPYVKSKAVNHEQNAANTLELGESPKEALNAEAGLEFQALISGGADAAHEHGHAHEHAPNDHSHAHAHTHPDPHQPKPAYGNNGPPPEMQAKFSSMFNAWYNAKFGADTPTTTAKPAAKPVQTKQPTKTYTSKKRPGPVTKSVDKTALFEEFMTMFESQLNAGQVAKPTTKYPGKVTTKPVITKAPTQSPTITTVAPSTKAAQPKKSLSKSKAAKESYAKSPNAKFGPRKKTDYIKPTTPVYPIVQTTAAANDPTLVKLVTLSHPESLAYPLDTNATSGGNSNKTLQQGGATPPAENTGSVGLNTNVITRGQKPVNRRLRTTTVRPTPDPDLLADINEARVMQGLPEVQAHQVDLQGNLLPFYQRQMRIGRLPARPHPLHNPGGIHHQLQHQHEVPHYHPEQGLGAGFNSFQQLFYPQHTNNGAVMNYEPFPRPNIPVPTTAAPNSHASDPVRNTGNVAPLQMVDAGPLNPLATFYFISALNNLLQPQNNGRYQQLYQNRNGQNFNGQVHGELGGIPNSLDLHHQAIHMEAGNAMTPHLHRQVHRLLRNRELSRQRGNMFGIQPNFPAAVTQTPFIDPDLYADMMEAQAAAMAG